MSLVQGRPSEKLFRTCRKRRDSVGVSHHALTAAGVCCSLSIGNDVPGRHGIIGCSVLKTTPADETSSPVCLYPVKDLATASSLTVLSRKRRTHTCPPLPVVIKILLESLSCPHASRCGRFPTGRLSSARHGCKCRAAPDGRKAAGRRAYNKHCLPHSCQPAHCQCPWQPSCQ